MAALISTHQSKNTSDAALKLAGAIIHKLALIQILEQGCPISSRSTNTPGGLKYVLIVIFNISKDAETAVVWKNRKL